jgi:hypothetical protein
LKLKKEVRGGEDALLVSSMALDRGCRRLLGNRSGFAWALVCQRLVRYRASLVALIIARANKLWLAQDMVLRRKAAVVRPWVHQKA